MDKRKKIKPKIQVNDLIRVTDLKKTFSKRDTTNWSYTLEKIQIQIDTKPSYHIGVVGKANNSQSEQLLERYIEALLRKTELTMKEKKTLRTPQAYIKSECLCPSLLALTILYVNTEEYPLI